MSLKEKTLFISGGSRGIGLAIALKAAHDGANICIAAKTETSHPKLPGTIHTAAAEIEKAGGKALAVQCDIRSEDQVQAAVAACVARFGGVDICINNASAIALQDTLDVSMSRYDLMQQVNTRGTFLVSRTCIPHLRKSANPHVLSLSPPLVLDAKWFAPHLAYTSAKFGMSLCMLGMAAEFRHDGIAFNALWPRTAIATSAIKYALGGDEMMRRCRTPDIVADAAYVIFNKKSREFTGQFVIDDTFLAAHGVSDFERYRVDPSQPLLQDFFIPDSMPPPPGVSLGAELG